MNAPLAAAAHQRPVETHVTHETENRTRGAGESRQLAGAEQRRVRRLREGGEERRQLYQAAAARHRIDEARAERCHEHEAYFQGHECGIA